MSELVVTREFLRAVQSRKMTPQQAARALELSTRHSRFDAAIEVMNHEREMRDTLTKLQDLRASLHDSLEGLGSEVRRMVRGLSESYNRADEATR